MSEWRDISTAPRDGVFVLLHNDNWASDVEGFWHKGSQSWSANTRIPGIENRVISPEPPTYWKPLTVEEELKPVIVGNAIRLASEVKSGDAFG
jgi:hypothetical protein